jgi:hypothetical protein
MIPEYAFLEGLLNSFFLNGSRILFLNGSRKGH